MSERACVFIDFDGTFAEHGVAPREHGEAVLRARANGHTVLLCTGRPASIVAADVQELFDGLVASAGAHVRVGAELLRDDRFPAELARTTTQLLLEAGATFALEAPEAIYCTPDIAAEIQERVDGGVQEPRGGFGRGPRDILDAVVLPDDLTSCSYAKISVWGSPVPVSEIADRAGELVGALPNSISDDGMHSGELHLLAIDKADGIRQVAAHLGVDMAATVGIGDGMNDVGMLRAAGTGVGIGGSAPAVLAAADLLVPGPREHGIVAAFSRLGLI
ncbi:HAD hydrolase family protein [Brachybacterium hainanense]|uniref:HAD hydrolase family protein n=1 Tax=Brachybacterium hainanense TaxID=1541174 RepID=A0ABV6RAW4_9MICO